MITPVRLCRLHADDEPQHWTADPVGVLRRDGEVLRYDVDPVTADRWCAELLNEPHRIVEAPVAVTPSQAAASVEADDQPNVWMKVQELLTTVIAVTVSFAAVALFVGHVADEAIVRAAGIWAIYAAGGTAVLYLFALVMEYQAHLKSDQKMEL